ncbi:hypothetical protein ATCC90586_003544 [Pythium insidiosum]|nr:hypothetical protein ATCC90586_003544 [Pythium insidiosum]
MQAKVRVGPIETWIPSLPESLKHEFSLDELEQMMQQFCEFDDSGDGSIAADELVALMRSMGIETSHSEMQALIDKVDDNRSGELEFGEFVRLISEFRRGQGNKLAAFIQYSKLALEIRRELQDLTARPTSFSAPSAVKDTHIMLAQHEENEADVRREDQMKINEFGRNNARLYEIRDLKKALQDKLDTLDDANTELMMGDGGNVELLVGESFVEASEDFATEYLEKLVEETKQKVDALTAEEGQLEARQAVLKKALYGRFGQSINLEDK